MSVDADSLTRAQRRRERRELEAAYVALVVAEFEDVFRASGCEVVGVDDRQRSFDLNRHRLSGLRRTDRADRIDVERSAVAASGQFDAHAVAQRFGRGALQRDGRAVVASKLAIAMRGLRNTIVDDDLFNSAGQLLDGRV